MSNVIEGHFPDFANDEKSGYMISGEKIKGVYVGDLAASCEILIGGEMVTIYDKNADEMLIRLDIEEMNQFCLMWLCIFDSDVIKEDE